MIKGRGCPRYGGVALRAVRREVRRYVVRIRSALEIFEVAVYASRAGQVVVIVDVAIGALARRHRMSTAQRESHRIVIELGIHPVIAGMAGIAVGGEFSANVIGIGGGLKILEVTETAGRGHRLELALAPPLWQASQSTAACAPVSGKRLLCCWICWIDTCHPRTVWQASQLAPSCRL